MDNFALKINFKKVVITYIIIALVLLASICAFLSVKYKNKISYIMNYEKIKEEFKKKGITNNLKTEISKFTNYNDVADVVILENGNITYTLNNVYDEVIPVNNSKHIFTDSKNNVYKLVKKDELFIKLFINEDDHEYEDNFINNQYENEYYMSYIKDKKSNCYIIILNDINSDTNNVYLKIAGSIIIFMLMVYWIIVALMIYQNALKSKLNYFFWVPLVLLTNMLGVIIYLIYKYNRITCNNCHASNKNDSLYCTNCGEKIGISCTKCHNLVNKKDMFCKSCGKKLK